MSLPTFVEVPLPVADGPESWADDSNYNAYYKVPQIFSGVPSNNSIGSNNSADVQLTILSLLFIPSVLLLLHLADVHDTGSESQKLRQFMKRVTGGEPVSLGWELKLLRLTRSLLSLEGGGFVYV